MKKVSKAKKKKSLHMEETKGYEIFNYLNQTTAWNLQIKMTLFEETEQNTNDFYDQGCSNTMTRQDWLYEDKDENKHTGTKQRERQTLTQDFHRERNGFITAAPRSPLLIAATLVNESAPTGRAA